MATVNIFVNESAEIPIIEDVIIICPVEEMGKNSVMPSTMAIIIACKILITPWG
jgi:hypothetical protein